MHRSRCWSGQGQTWTLAVLPSIRVPFCIHCFPSPFAPSGAFLPSFAATANPQRSVWHSSTLSPDAGWAGLSGPQVLPSSPGLCFRDRRAVPGQRARRGASCCLWGRVGTEQRGMRTLGCLGAESPLQRASLAPAAGSVDATQGHSYVTTTQTISRTFLQPRRLPSKGDNSADIIPQTDFARS